ncbi:hypothetical protein [Prosthecobacter sp.]|uniref:hypothetical protein n=1 Tax=Prosthecobacter sp. TaxID=1965333 RepID=UPI0037846B27
MKTFLTLAAVTVIGATAMPSSASALDLFHPFRPRVNQVNGRMSNEQQRINHGVATGKLNSWQANRLERGQQNIQRQESRDLMKHNGHLTWRDRLHLNRKENMQSQRINQAEHRNIFQRWFGRR